jgi:tRNA pseudouridine38-40 synthase
MRYLKLTIAYEGTHYVGWQIQPNGISIQQVLESAWHSVTGESLRITASGRTDSGVHALGQACSLETRSVLPVDRLTSALNAHLPGDIRVLGTEEAVTGFHAIRDATGKTYRYCLQDGSCIDLFQRNYCWYIPVRLDVPAMQRAAACLIGQHDFSSFQASGSDRQDAIRTIRKLQIGCRSAAASRMIDLEVSADGFLYNMVRNIVGTLVAVGRGKQPESWVAEVLAGRDRRLAGPTAPAQGLFLVEVEYDS